MTTPDDEHLLSSAIPAFAMAWKALLLDPRVTDKAVRMYLVLATYTRPGRMTAFPGQARLAAELNCDVKTIQRAGDVLVQTGWIEKVRRGNGRSNLYHLRMPGVLVAVHNPVGNPVDTDDAGIPDATELSLLDTTRMSLPYEVEEGEVITPHTPRKRGTARTATRAPLSAAERADDFAAWWESYPRRVGKIGAETAWRQMLDRLPDIDTLITASAQLADRTAREHPESTEWVRFVPHPATWLRRGDYLDLSAAPDRPPVRNPCALCGVPNPCPEVCLGVGQGSIGSVIECVWA